MLIMEKKKTLGRRKIELKKIDKKTTLQVTFSKRRHGLFRKASELALLCGAEVAIVVQSPAEKVFTFGHPSVEALLSRVGAPSTARIIRYDDRGMRSCQEAIKMLEAEKNRIDVDGGGFWWENSFEGLELPQLEEFLAALERQRDDVAARVKMFESFTINSAAAPVQEFSAVALSAAAPVQEFSAAALSTAALVQDFSAAASIQEFNGQDKDLFDVLDSIINSKAAPVQEFSAAAASIQEFRGAASASDSSYHSQPFDEDQDLFDVSYLFEPSDQDQDFHAMLN